MTVGLSRCIFCETKTKLTGEHSFWPRWSKRYLPPQPKGTHRRVTIQSSKSSPKIHGIHTDRSFHGQLNSIRLHVVCGPRCNNGWMRRCENLTKPILGPLILGQPAVLNREDQLALATWAVMKSMTSEFSEPADVATPQIDRTKLMLKNTIPSGWKIYLGHVRIPDWRMQYHRNAVKLGLVDIHDGKPKAHQGSLRKNTQTIAVGIGELFVWIMSTTVPHVDFKPPPQITRHVHQIWPFQRTILWPPGTILTGSAANVVANTLNRELWNMKWTSSDGESATP